MKEEFRIRFNPGTGEIEIEGSERFVKTYFRKLQKLAEQAPETGTGLKTVQERRNGIGQSKVKPAKAGPQKKTGKPPRKVPGEKKSTNIDRIVRLIQESPEGITTAELKVKTGLTENQIWNIVNRTAKAGSIRKMKRGVYTAA